MTDLRAYAADLDYPTAADLMSDYVAGHLSANVMFDIDQMLEGQDPNDMLDRLTDNDF